LLIIILTTEFLPTTPTPRFTTTMSFHEPVFCVKSTSKYVITCIILQTPSFAPGTHFRIVAHLI
jgi:hypothetical protein